MAFVEPGDPADLADVVRTAFAEAYGGPPAVVARAPGRVNLIGEHTDYNRGLVLPVALPHATYAAMASRPDDVVRIGSLEEAEPWTGTLDALPVSLGIMDFAFMGGSMGSVVGEKIARLGQRSLERKYPLIVVSASGGARMQEGVLSLMQMAKVSAMLAQLAEPRIPYISILTNPTTGGVSASYAMLGDAILAEPGAVIGFAGPRVIKQTLGQDLPEGFQTSEFLLDHGMLDAVSHRRNLKRTVSQLLRHMTGRPAATGWTTS